MKLLDPMFQAPANLIPCGPFYNILTIVELPSCGKGCDENNVWICGWPCVVLLKLFAMWGTIYKRIF